MPCQNACYSDVLATQILVPTSSLTTQADADGSLQPDGLRQQSESSMHERQRPSRQTCTPQNEAFLASLAGS